MPLVLCVVSSRFRRIVHCVLSSRSRRKGTGRWLTVLVLQGCGHTALVLHTALALEGESTDFKSGVAEQNVQQDIGPADAARTKVCIV
jgi:hypothetical protein